MITASQLDGDFTGSPPADAALAAFGRRAPTVGDRLVYAIGDIHGRLDLFQQLLSAICDDALACAPRYRPILVLLGDYIDRGANSAGVLSLIVELCAHDGLEVRPLRGNHEEALLNFLDNPSMGPTWMRFGGAPTLSSYGVTSPRRSDDEQAWAEAGEKLLAAMPASHVAMLRDTELLLEIEDYVFVHAGVRPGIPLHQQSADDLLWIRGDFLNHRSYFDKQVVHGHSADAKPQILPWRIGIDTGAYATGVLTALRLHGAEQRLIHAALTANGPFQP